MINVGIEQVADESGTTATSDCTVVGENDFITFVEAIDRFHTVKYKTEVNVHFDVFASSHRRNCNITEQPFGSTGSDDAITTISRNPASNSTRSSGGAGEYQFGLLGVKTFDVTIVTIKVLVGRADDHLLNIQSRKIVGVNSDVEIVVLNELVNKRISSNVYGRFSARLTSRFLVILCHIPITEHVYRI